MNQFIEPKILQGTRDFLPEQMAKRDFVMEKIKTTFAKFGYDAIETPALEYAKTILGKYGEEGAKLVYRFNDNGNRDICLRYDQTVPFARVVATNYKTLPMPFKRYQIGRVWRADRPARGRYREFYQCDIDIIGTQSLVAEAEIAKVIADVYTALGFPKFIIKFNSRRLINSILSDLEIPVKNQASIIRVLDKMDKLSLAEIRQEIKLLVSDSKARKLLELIRVEGTTKEKLKLFQKYNTSEIQEFLEIAQAFGVSDDALVFDPGLARGLDYYTGIIFEVYIPGVNIGAVCAGGRYDDLCSLFCSEKFSGVGVAFGFDRIIVAMEQLGLLNDPSLNSQVLIAHFDSETLSDSLKILGDVQSAGLNAEIYFEPEKLSKQLKYADKKNIPFVVMCGLYEKERGEVTIKIMRTGKQKTIPKNQIINYFKGYSSL